MMNIGCETIGSIFSGKRYRCTGGAGTRWQWVTGVIGARPPQWRAPCPAGNPQPPWSDSGPKLWHLLLGEKVGGQAGEKRQICCKCNTSACKYILCSVPFDLHVQQIHLLMRQLVTVLATSPHHSEQIVGWQENTIYTTHIYYTTYILGCFAKSIFQPKIKVIPSCIPPGYI